MATADPITFATDAIGWYAVQVNANDIATTGAEPPFFLATLPAGPAVGRAPGRRVGPDQAERRVGLIVVGTHGSDPVDRMFFGSTADHVVRDAPCPVLTVRPTRTSRSVAEGPAPVDTKRLRAR